MFDWSCLVRNNWKIIKNWRQCQWDKCAILLLYYSYIIAILSNIISIDGARHPCSLVVFEQRRLRQVCCCGCVLMSPTATDTGGSQCVSSVLAYFFILFWLVQNIEIGFVNVNLYRSEEKSHFDIQEWGGWQNDDLIQNCTDCVVVAEMPEDTLKTHRVGSRKSELALIQTRFVISELEKLCPGHSFTIVEVTVVKSSS